jgi:hypothetical protein
MEIYRKILKLQSDVFHKLFFVNTLNNNITHYTPLTNICSPSHL